MRCVVVRYVNILISCMEIRNDDIPIGSEMLERCAIAQQRLPMRKLT